MARNYKRAYSLTIVDPDGVSRTITENRINFEITKTVLSLPNLCRLTIINPSPETVTALQRKFTTITLNAGYGEELKLLYTGQVRNAFEGLKGTERTITVYAGDGQKDYQNAIFNKTFTEDISISNAITEVLDSFKEVTIGAINGLPQVSDKLRGQTLSGSSSEILDEFAEQYGFNWSIQNGEVNVTPDNQIIEGTEAVLINSATGMLNSPTLTDDGVEVSTLLNPSVTPNTLIVIESVNTQVQIGNLFLSEVKPTSAEGTYSVQEVTFTGDSREGEWKNFIKGAPFNG